MEIVAIVNVLALGWVKIILKLPEIGLAKLGLVLGGEALLDRVVEALLVLVVYCRAGCSRERFAVQVLTRNLRNIARVARHMLRLDVLCRPADPVLAL